MHAQQASMTPKKQFALPLRPSSPMPASQPRSSSEPPSPSTGSSLLAKMKGVVFAVKLRNSSRRGRAFKTDCGFCLAE
eukprot:1826898-Rhodomonas_salina.1